MRYPVKKEEKINKFIKSKYNLLPQFNQNHHHPKEGRRLVVVEKTDVMRVFSVIIFWQKTPII